MEKYFSVLQTVREHVKLNYQRTINDNDVCLVRRPRSSKPVALKTFNQRYCWMRPSLRRRTTKKNMTRKKKQFRVTFTIHFQLSRRRIRLNISGFLLAAQTSFYKTNAENIRSRSRLVSYQRE